MTKKQEQLLDNYNRAKDIHDLRQVYGRWSDKKEEAYRNCLVKQSSLDGYDGRITSASGWKFTYAFRYKDECGREHLYRITKDTDTDFIIG